MVSFDVFDTLLTRKTYFPTDPLAFAEQSARQVTNGKVKNFRKMRLEVEQSLRENALMSGKSQDVTLDEIYKELGTIYNLTESELAALKDIELTAEARACVRREAGYALYEYARRSGKDIIAISDTCHTSEFIGALLKSNGYKDIIKVYVSSEVGKRKHEGGLYEHVLSELGIPGRELVHIGDNIDGDINSARKYGIVAIHLRRASEGIELANAAFKDIADGLRSWKTPFDSISMSLIARRYFDNPHDKFKPNTLFDGDAFKLGYIGLGPVIVGFASWIYQQAKRENIKQIAFLSRDGLIVKKVFDILYHDVGGEPETKYIYASRRAARVASIMCWADICEVIEKPVYSTTLGEYFASRFGVGADAIPKEIFIKYGLAGPDHRIGAKFDKHTLLSIAADLKDIILERARLERESYIAYLKSVGLDNGSAALVDLGYVGSMQAAIQKLLNIDLLGLYFATFEGARSEVLDQSRVRGYVGQFLSPKGSVLTIQTHRFVYETLFCSGHDSFVCFDGQKVNGKLVPVFQSSANDDVRRRIIAEVHAGVELFAAEFKEALGDARTLNVEPRSATRILDVWLRNPCIDDALILEGVTFEDPTGPVSLRYLVPPRELLIMEEVQAGAIWKEGLNAVKRMKHISSEKGKEKNAGTTLLPQPHYPRLEQFIIRILCNEKKKRKYFRDREQFFADSRNRLVQWYSKHFVDMKRRAGAVS